MYQKVREIFGTLPEGFLEEKTYLQNKVLFIHHDLLTLRTKLALDDMNSKAAQINLMLIKANELVLKNNILGASQLYDQIEDLYRSLPDGFLVKKTDLQNRILQISGEIAKKLDRISTLDMQNKTAKINSQIKIVQDYLKRGEHDMALAEYEEIVNIYNQMPAGFLEAKTKIRAETLNLYKNIISSTDAFLIENLDQTTKKKYDEILKLLVRIHQHIDAKEFQMMQSLYDRITELYNELPVGFVQKKTKVVSDILAVYKKMRMYQTCLELQDFVRQRDFEGLRQKLEYIYKIYNELIDLGFEDLQLFNFVYSKYFTYHRILLEERRIKRNILIKGIPNEIKKKMPEGKSNEINGLRQRIMKAEGHVSNLNFEFVRPVRKTQL